jgi:hypothetical protein
MLISRSSILLDSQRKMRQVFIEIPFLDRMGFVFIMCIVGMWIISVYENKRGVKTNGLEVDRSMFKLSPGLYRGCDCLCAGYWQRCIQFFW